MLGMLGSSGDTTPAAAEGGGGEVGGVGTSIGGLNEEEEMLRIEEAERSSGSGNRWPRQETLALLKVRSDMDAAFRDSSLKGPLWEEVSRKLAELGYNRSAKKCKEKFDNVFKYHKRTKEGRATKSDGKTYRFFDQLEALENHPNSPQFLLPTRPQPQAMPPVVSLPLLPVTVPPINLTNPPPSNLPQPPPPPQLATTNAGIPSSRLKMPAGFASIFTSSSSSTSSDEGPHRRRKRKRKWESFSERLMKEVVQKQEEMQKRFLERLEQRERDRVEREEAWRVQETARMNREHDLLVHERSMAAAKDAAVISFLQKISGQQQIPNAAQIQMQMQMQMHENPAPPPTQAIQPPQPPQVQPTPPILPPAASSENLKTDNGGENVNILPTSSSRWPKAEVEALIRIRTNLDFKYQDGGPKGPLWEEISAAMRRLGYNRNPKRCKEKWENINKYFKKVKDSNKTRPEDSKTCPYFHQLEALYRERTKIGENNTVLNPMVPIMVRPEQQWPLPAENRDNENNEDTGDGQEEEEEEEDEEDEAGGYEIVVNKAGAVE